MDIRCDRRNNIGLAGSRGLHQATYPGMHQICGREEAKNGDQPESGQNEERPFDAGRNRVERNRFNRVGHPESEQQAEQEKSQKGNVLRADEGMTPKERLGCEEQCRSERGAAVNQRAQSS